MALIDDILKNTKPVNPIPARSVQYHDLPISTGDFEYLQKIGFSPDAIRSAYAPYDPDSNKSVLENIYKLSAKQPSAPDEKKVQNAQTIAGIGDALGMLGQMWAAGKGAHVRERDYGQTASGQLSDRVDQLRNLYTQRSAEYDQGLYDARMRDFVRGLNDYDTNRKGIQTSLQSKAKADMAQKNWETKFDQNQKNFETSQKAKRENDAVTQAQGWARVQDAQNRTLAYIAKQGTTGNYQMIIPANASDPEAQTDQFGNPIRSLTMSEGQIDAYARQALNDPAFLQRHPQLVLQRPDLTGSGSYRYKPNQDIAAAYVKELYDAGAPADSQQFDLSASSRPAYRGPVRNDESDEWDEFEVSEF